MLPLVNLGAQKLGRLVADHGAQKRLADELNMDQGYLSRIARAERVPGLEVRRKLKAHGIELDDWDIIVADESSPVATSEKGAA